MGNVRGLLQSGLYFTFLGISLSSGRQVALMSVLFPVTLQMGEDRQNVGLGEEREEIGHGDQP